MTMAITKAVEEGAQAVICASTGNTSASAAAYAARAGLTCAVLVPQGKIAIGKLAQALVHGAKLLQVDGNFDDCLALASKLAIDYPVSLVNTVNPYRIEGQKTAVLRDRRRARRRPGHPLPAGRQRRQHHRLLAGLPRVRRRRHRHPHAADVRLPGRRRRADRDRRRSSSTRRRSPPRSGSATRRPGPRRWPPGTSPAAASTPSPTGRSSPPTGCWPAARRSSSSRPRRPRSPGCCRSPRPASSSPGQRVVCTVTGNGLKDPEWAISGAPAPVTIPVDAAAAAAQLGLLSASPARVRVRVPATSANLGPAFDCAGLALSLLRRRRRSPSSRRGLDGRRSPARAPASCPPTSRTWSCAPSGPPATSSAGRPPGLRVVAAQRHPAGPGHGLVGRRGRRRGAGRLGAVPRRRRASTTTPCCGWPPSSRGTRTTSRPACSAARRCPGRRATGPGPCGSTVDAAARARCVLVPDGDAVDARRPRPAARRRAARRRRPQRRPRPRCSCTR